MNENSRKRLLLGMLLVLLAILAIKQLPRSSSPTRQADRIEADGTPGPRRGRSSRRGRKKAETPKEVRELYLAALDPQPHQYEIGRNLWAFYVPQVAPPPPPPPREPTRVITPPPPQPPPPPVGPQPPPIHFKYLGSFGPKRRRIAVLADGDELINALEGDVVMNEFRVARIGYESVYIEYVDFPDEKAAQLKVGG